MAGIRKIIRDSCAQHRHLCRDMRRDQHDHYEVSDDVLGKIKSALPYFEGNYDPRAYINWELAVDSEFQKHVLSEKQKEVRNHEKEERDMKEPPIPLFTLKFETPPSSKEDIQGKVNGTEINQGECIVNEVNLSTFHAKVEQPLVEPNAGIPLSQVDLLAVPCDKEELCDNASLISMPQLVNEHAIPSVSLCADFKHAVHIANEVEERKLLSSLNTLGYVQFDDFCELDNLKEKLFAKSDLLCPINAIFHIFGKYNDRGIYLVHRVFICSDLEKHVIANHTTSSFSSFDWMKQVILNGLCEEHHMEKPRTVFREEGEDDVTMATTDTSVAHIMDEQQDIKFESSKCQNPIRPPATLLTSNGRRSSIRPPFSAREYLMESSRSPLSNASSLIAKFHLSRQQLKKKGIGLICTGKISNPRRVSGGSAQPQFAAQFNQFEPVPQQVQGVPQQRPWADRIADVMREQFGLKPKDTGNLYRHPYLECSGKEERYDFDITKADKIFDLLLRKKHIQLPAGHTVPSAQELGKRRYCKWHKSGSHTTNNCKVFRQQIQAAIEGGKIKFDDSKKPTKVDGNPFPINMERHYEEDDGGFDPQWDCEFFRFCWNEGMRLPSMEDCPGCSGVAESSSRSYNRSNRLRQTRVPVHQRLGPVNQDHDQEDDEGRKTQWCPSGIFTKNQKRRVQRLRNRERFQEVEQEINHRLKKAKLRQEWRIKNKDAIADEAKAHEAKRLAKGKSVVTASVNMVFALPAEFGAKQADVDEVEEASARLVLSPEQAIFEKPEGIENQHLKPLYINGYVNRKPMSKMMVDGGAAVNLMPYATFRKLGKNAEDLIKKNMVLKDFGGNPSETKGVLNVELTVGSKTVPTTFFIIDGKGSYSLLLGRDWIHANCCIPSTMHQCLFQWQGDKIEIVPAYRSVNVASADLAFWEMDGIDCLSGKIWDGDFLKMESPSYYFEGVMEGSNVYTKDTVDNLDDKQGQGFMSADDLEEVDIGLGDRPRPTFIIPVIKKNGKVKVCIDFRDLNKATPKDKYPMPVADQLVDAASGHKILSFVDGNAGYNQIFMAEEDIHKTAFRCPRAIGLFEWVVMTFGLKSAGATYQRAMNYIYHDLIGWLVEVYIDDVVVKSKEIEDHLADLRKVFERTRKYGLKMNPTKCAFGVTACQSVGFLVHERGIEITQRSINAIKMIQPPEDKTELQEMISKINFVRRFISNLSGRLGPFTPLLRLKADQKFTWGAEQQKALDNIKKYLSSPLVLIPPQKGIPFRLYLSTGEKSIGSVLIQELEGKERVVFYLSRRLFWMQKQVCTHGCGIGLLIISPRGASFEFAYTIKPYATNNQAEYEAVLKGLQLFKEVEADAIEIMGDSLLVISQLAGEFECKDDTLIVYNEKCRELMKGYLLVTLKHVSREQNVEAIDLAQGASGYKPMVKDVNVEIATNPSQSASRKLRYKTLKYTLLDNELYYRTIEASRKLRYEALKYTLLDNELYYRTIDGVLLKCLSADHAKVVIEEGCQDCQKFGAIERALASAMNPIIKPWPFKGWGIDMIGMINPPSSKGHKIILVATDYFTKWVEVISLKKVDSGDAIQFVQEHIIYRFGIPQTITTDQGLIFGSDEFVQFANSMGIKLLNSSPYYAQANGQAEASNKSLIKLIKRNISDYPQQWHTRLAVALWSYRMACHGSIQVPPYKLVYGHEAVLPWEVRIGSRRTELQNELTADEYYNLMADEREDLVQSRLRALAKVTKDKEHVARHYNKKVVPKTFSEGELVWKLILPIGTRDNKFGKWSPNWEGPFQIHKVVSKEAYMLQGLDGEVYGRALNGKYLKKYYPSVWVNA
uniref:B1234D02.11 protein n=1 Tax=Oryza sativa subsp. japonica TaxID=39947 RepID=Q7XWM4_ORYSJ|nr:OSJNBb0052B05.5 [Oryza sativa Japonica Group]CAE75887.1 B1234D02.11 [Oryza sativa Japonica Group]